MIKEFDALMEALPDWAKKKIIMSAFTINALIAGNKSLLFRWLFIAFYIPFF